MRMKYMLVLGLTTAVHCGASASNYVWSGGNTSSGPDAAKEFAENANWQDGEYPNADDASVDVTPAGRWGNIALDERPVRLKSLTGYSTRIIGTQTLVFTAPSGKDPDLTDLSLYAPARLESGSLYCLGGLSICNDFQVDPAAGRMWAYLSGISFRDDYWATSQGGVREFSPIPTAIEYHGSYSFYSPRAGAGGGNFTLVANSPYATVSGAFYAYNVCSAGQAVSGTGIDVGTYVRRIFDATTIELSRPAQASAANASLSFSEQTVKGVRHFGVIGHNGSTDHNTSIRINRRSEDEDYAVEADILNVYPLQNDKRRMSLSCAAGYIPGKLIIHNTLYPGVDKKSRIALENCYVQFDAPKYDVTAGETPAPGFPWSEVEFANVDSTATICVTGTLHAVIARFLSFNGTLVKTGEGSLTASVAANAEVLGSVTVEGGAFGFADDVEAAAPIVIESLTVKAGATFVVPIQGVAPSFANIEPGATISGRGALHFTNFCGLTGVNVGEGAVIAIDDGSVHAITEAPAVEVVGDPAFWVDCSQTNKMTLVDLGDGRIGVCRIDDVRKESDGDDYLFSTNCAGDTPSVPMPTVKYDNGRQLNHLYFSGCSTANPEKRIDLTDAHAWSRPVADVKVVFEVYGGDGSEYSGSLNGTAPFLGSSSEIRLASAVPEGTVAVNANVWSRYWSGDTMFSWATEDMKEYSSFMVNGMTQNVRTAMFPYASPNVQTGAAKHFCPIVAELTLPWNRYDQNNKRKCYVADAYTFCPNYAHLNETKSEQKHFCELIVYTNELTAAERLSVRRYLMRKWLGKDASCSLREINDSGIDVVSGGLSVPSGASCYAEKLVADGAFRKTGSGSLYIEDGYSPNTSVSVDSGTLQIRSFDLASPRLTDDDQVWAYFDASRIDAEHFTCAEDQARGVKTVTVWKDVKPGDGVAHNASLWQVTSTNLPFIAENKQNGLSVLDFGPFYKHSVGSDDAKRSASSLTLSQSRRHHTVMAVWGSENGGGELLGELYSYWGNGYGLARGNSTCGEFPGDPILRYEGHLMLDKPYTYEFRKNGESVDPTVEGLSGAFDMVSFTSLLPFGVEALQAVDNDVKEFTGGGQFGEMIICDVGLSSSRMNEIEAYLGKKWFNRDTDGYRTATLGSVSVASGATLEVTGGGQLSVGALSLMGGVINGAVTLRPEASIEVAVDANGAIATTMIDGAIDLSNGGRVTFSGATRTLSPGRYELLSCADLTFAANWEVDVSSLPRRCRLASLAAVDGRLVLEIVRSGMLITIQ